MWCCNNQCEVCKLPQLNQHEKEKVKKKGSESFCRIVPSELKISKSTISGAGLGVFTKKALAKGIVIGNYEGHLRREEDLFSKYIEKNRFLWDLTGLMNGFVLDSFDPKSSNFARFVNHNRSENRNLVALGHAPRGRPTVAFVTTRNLKANTELFVDYGTEFNDYLRSQGFVENTDAQTGEKRSDMIRM